MNMSESSNSFNPALGASQSITREITGVEDMNLPEFLCGCGVPAHVFRAGTPRNRGRLYLACGRSSRVCYTWLWQDQLRKYSDDLQNYVRCSTIDVLKENLCICHSELQSLHKINESLQSEISMLKNQLGEKAASADSQRKDVGRGCRRFQWLLLLSFVLFFFVSKAMSP